MPNAVRAGRVVGVLGDQLGTATIDDLVVDPRRDLVWKAEVADGRLMVTGRFALRLGVSPRRVHEWSLAVYVDAVDWVEAPNTLGLSQHADGGIMASKPYAASGRYIQRMSNSCRGGRVDPGKRAGARTPARSPHCTGTC